VAPEKCLRQMLKVSTMAIFLERCRRKSRNPDRSATLNPRQEQEQNRIKNKGSNEAASKTNKLAD
jgi:hypothetical protein